MNIVMQTNIEMRYFSAVIPAELQAQSTWLMHRDKKPVDLTGLYNKPYDDKSIWMRMNSALALAERKGLAVGISLTEDGLKVCDDHYVHCFDLDGFLCGSDDENGVETFINKVGSYTEISPSSTGLKIFVAVAAKPRKDMQIVFSPSKFAKTNPEVRKYQNRCVEVFSQKRFLAVTGQSYTTPPLPLKLISAEEFDALIDYLDQWARREGGSGVKARSAAPKPLNASGVTEGNSHYGKLTEACLKAVLGRIKHVDEQSWSDACNALARAYGESGRGYFIQWSKDGYGQGAYQGFDEEEVNARYDRALREVTGKLGFGCKYLCEQAGFNPSQLQWEKTVEDFGSGSLFETLGISKEMVVQRQLFPEQGMLSELDSVDVHPKQITKIREARGDVLNGQIFAAQAAGQFLYVNSDKVWMMWSQAEQRWTRCNKSEHIQFAKQVAQARLLSAAKEFIGDAKRLNEIARMQDQHKLLAMIDMAATEESVAVGSLVEFDADPNLLGVRNGVIDLRSSKLLPPTPEQRITKQCNVEFDEGALCPLWERFMLQCFKGDATMVDYMQRAMGYTLSGFVGEEVMHFWFGNGCNGKSVAINVFSRILDDYVHVAGTELITSNDGKSKDTKFAALRGARLVMLNETKAGQRLDDSAIKLLVGREPIAARKLYGDTFSFLPTAKLYVRGNHKPIVQDTSAGMWRRLRLVPFTNNVPEDEVDPNLEAKLWSERAGILNWMLRGYAEYQKRGLKPPQAIAQAGNNYRHDSDLLNEWLEDNTDQSDPNTCTPVGLVYMDYTQWAKEQGIKIMSNKALTQRLQEHGVSAGRTNRARFYAGLKLLNASLVARALS